MKRVLVLLGLTVVPTLSGCVVATSSGRSGGGSILGFLFVPFLLTVVLAMAARRAHRRAVVGTHEQIRPGPAGQRVDGPDVTMLRAELSVLADDVLRLEPQVTLNEHARDDYEAAVLRYRVALAALDSNQPVDPWRLQRVVDEATWSMSRVRAALAGRPLPPPPEPLAHPGVRGEPAIATDAAERPVYRDLPVPYRSGWFGGGGGLFGGLLLGSMLGGMGGWWMSDGVDDGTADDGMTNGGDW